MNPLAALIALQSAYGAIVFVLAATAFGFAWHYYEAVLREEGPDRNELVQRLSRGGGPRSFYIDQMTALLDRVDVLLGDAGQEQTLIARIIGLRHARPCWTVRSFDTCALLAVMYPLLSLVLTWTFAGDAGPIGDLLGLRPQPTLFIRVEFATAVGLSYLAYFHALRTFDLSTLDEPPPDEPATKVLRSFGAWSAVAGFAVFFAGLVSATPTDVPYGQTVVAIFIVIIADVAARSAGFAFSILAALADVGIAATVAGLVVVAIVAFADASTALVFTAFTAGAFAVAAAGAGSAAVIGRTRRAIQRRYLIGVWIAFWPITVFLTYSALWIGGRILSLTPTTCLLVMICLLPMVNIPFDWASIGLTRALLRRGCEDHGSWLLRSPTFLGALDLMLGLVLLATLAVSIVGSLAVADAILLHTSHRAEFDAVRLVENVEYEPTNPAHAWMYFTLLSTLFPGILNLLIGILSLLTFSVPPVRHWLIVTIPSLSNPGMGGTRWRVTFALSSHWFVGVLLTGFGMWLTWRGFRSVPDAERMALGLLRAFAIWCTRQLGIPEFDIS